MSNRWRSWKLKRRRRKEAEQNRTAPLREFVYLDEVSVFSLIGARMGPIESEFTSVEASSLLSEAGSETGVDVAVARAKVNSRIQSNVSQSSQVIRKATVQSTFKRLYDLERDRLGISLLTGDVKIPSVASLVQLAKAAGDGAHPQWVIDPRSLERGQLVEIEVELESEAIFRAGTMIATFSDLMAEDPDLFPNDGLEGAMSMEGISRILDKLLVGLVPLRGRAVDYEAIQLDGVEYIVHRRLLAQVRLTDDIEGAPVYVVGVADQQLFWKDIRRILFAKSQYRVLCRISRSGIHARWNPVKLADLLRPVIPTIEQDMEAAGKMFESIDVTVDPQEDSPRATLAALLASYITQAANVLQGAPFSVDQLLSILDGLDLPESIDDLTVRRGLFRAVDSRIEEYAGVALSRDDAARLRQEVVGQPPGMNSGVAASTAPVVTEPAAEMTESAQRVIDTEIVAIYW